MAAEGYFFVADLLGFGKIIKNLREDDAKARVEQWVDLVRASTRSAGVEQFQLISDTVFAAAPGTSEGLGRLIELGKRLLTDGIYKSLPVRGAIVHGTYTWGHDLIYGKAVIDAHNLEMSQNWIGISCATKLPHGADHLGVGKLIMYTPPKKAGPAVTQAVVDWEVPMTAALMKFVGSGGLLADQETYTWELADKVNNTLLFSLYKSSMSVMTRGAERSWGVPNLELVEAAFVTLATHVAKNAKEPT